MSSLRFVCSPLLLAATPLLTFAAIAPASANELASLNSGESINGYMEQQEIDELKAWRSRNQVTSVNQFSDVRPTDWAYQALSNLVEKYGCVAGYPNGTYKGGQAMTRYEAAALLNACLDRVTEVTDELQRLMDEFKKELAVLKGRVDGLEAKVGTLEAQQFSLPQSFQALRPLSSAGLTIQVAARTTSETTAATWYPPLRMSPLTTMYNLHLTPALQARTCCVLISELVILALVFSGESPTHLVIQLN